MNSNRTTKKKKPFYFRWWFILLVIILISSAFSSKEEPVQPAADTEDVPSYSSAENVSTEVLEEETAPVVIFPDVTYTEPETEPLPEEEPAPAPGEALEISAEEAPSTVQPPVESTSPTEDSVVASPPVEEEIAPPVSAPEQDVYAPPPAETAPTYEEPAETEAIVYITETGSKYHLGSCRHLSKSKIPISLSQAQAAYGPCGTCNP